LLRQQLDLLAMAPEQRDLRALRGLVFVLRCRLGWLRRRNLADNTQLRRPLESSPTPPLALSQE
jgi:hypothetical protein